MCDMVASTPLGAALAAAPGLLSFVEEEEEEEPEIMMRVLTTSIGVVTNAANEPAQAPARADAAPERRIWSVLVLSGVGGAPPSFEG